MYHVGDLKRLRGWQADTEASRDTDSKGSPNCRLLAAAELYRDRPHRKLMTMTLKRPFQVQSFVSPMAFCPLNEQ